MFNILFLAAMVALPPHVNPLFVPPPHGNRPAAIAAPSQQYLYNTPALLPPPTNRVVTPTLATPTAPHIIIDAFWQVWWLKYYPDAKFPNCADNDKLLDSWCGR